VRAGYVKDGEAEHGEQSRARTAHEEPPVKGYQTIKLEIPPGG